MRSDEELSFIERARRRQFVECALDSLHEKGFAGTSLAAVAERAGVAKSVVVYHFGSKQALLEAVVDSVYAGAAPAVLAAVEGAGGPRERLLAYVRACVLFAADNGRALAAVGEVFRNLRTADGGLRYTAADSDALISYVEGLLEDGQDAGELGDFHARTVAVMIRASIDALPGLFSADPDLQGADVADRMGDAVARMTS
ncbi:TetR/AcrR family transcriptional regulator [Kineosporia babensis]|uniref:TetR/AcrR family transcriptional regulator n=1 Tax=Kineosporia babensis TaxID=499548 RepID=A0A9X1SVS4_9ACTN|nr:TetR/AcrR family transcriptional regulator [Kineosporia babensis]MCD5313991.1 TetR/AcrR family transcriptional regulator [Kineosporia babensis]